MANILTYHQIINLLHDIQQRHPNLNYFFVGKDWNFNAENDNIVYPCLQVYLDTATLPMTDTGIYKVFNVSIICKVLNPELENRSNQTDNKVITIDIAKQIVDELSTNPFYQRSSMGMQGDIQFTDLENWQDDDLDGTQFTLNFRLQNLNTWCGLPFQEIPGYSATGPIITGYSFSTQYLPIGGGTMSGPFDTTSTILSGGTNLYSIFLTTNDGNDITRVQPGTNTYTGGTGNNPTVNISAATLSTLTVSGATSLATVSATTFISGSTNLYNIFQVNGNNSVIGNGTNTYTGGSFYNQTVNVSALTINTITASGASSFVTLTASTLIQSPIHYGGIGTGSSLTIQSTSNASTNPGADIIFKNGLNEMGRFLTGNQNTGGTISFLVIGGGGSGGGNSSTNDFCGGGGGAGGYSAGTTSITNISYTITVGSGGTATAGVGNNGGNSSIGSLITATGGGRGGSWDSPLGVNGGSGGGGAGRNTAETNFGGSGTTSQGTSGGTGFSVGTPNVRGGGGGGAGQSGGTATSASVGGAGGSGLTSSISGVLTTYAGGGGGGAYATQPQNAGGNGGGAAGVVGAGNGNNATANTGGGGGGAANQSSGAAKTGGNGGSGIVIISYVTGTLTATGGIITTAGGNTIHKFTSNDTFVIYNPPNTFRVSGNIVNGTQTIGFEKTNLTGTTFTATLSATTLTAGTITNGSQTLGTETVNLTGTSFFSAITASTITFAPFPSTGSSTTLTAYTQGTYTPVWSSAGTQPSIGNGTLTGHYTIIGNLCNFHIYLQAGSTTTFGTSNYRWSLPFAASGLLSNPTAQVMFFSNTTNTYQLGASVPVNSTTIAVYGPTGTGAGASQFSNSVPTTWTTGNTFITIQGFYYL